MTNPNDSVGTNAGYDGRTTPKAFNDVLASLTSGVLSGWACTPKTGMTVQIGGGSDRDVAIAEDNAGNRTTINNRSGAPIEITLSGAPATNNRIDAIVAYVDAAQSGTGATSVDFPEAVGFITVEGTIAANPSAPDDAAIRAAITADGSTGANAYYVVLATILVGTGVTSIGSGVITAGSASQPTMQIPLDNVDLSTIDSADLNPLTTTSRLDIGKWHFYYTTFTNSTAGWAEHTLTVPSDFGGNIKDIHLSATFGNSANNYGCTWWGQASGSTSVKVRFQQTSAGSNGWFALIVAIF